MAYSMPARPASTTSTSPTAHKSKQMTMTVVYMHHERAVPQQVPAQRDARRAPQHPVHGAQIHRTSPPVQARHQHFHGSQHQAKQHRRPRARRHTRSSRVSCQNKRPDSAVAKDATRCGGMDAPGSGGRCISRRAIKSSRRCTSALRTVTSSSALALLALGRGVGFVGRA